MSSFFTPRKVEVIADLFTNLAAGWYGAVVIFPIVLRARDPFGYLVALTINIAFGTLSLLIAFRLKESIYEST